MSSNRQPRHLVPQDRHWHNGAIMSENEQKQTPGSVHATNEQKIEFRNAQGEVLKTLGLDDLESNEECLLYALFFQQAQMNHNLNIIAASVVAELQMQTQIHERVMSQRVPDVDETLSKVMDRVQALTGMRFDKSFSSHVSRR